MGFVASFLTNFLVKLLARHWTFFYLTLFHMMGGEEA